MIATLVIGLREGLEAALIVGIVAAFVRRNGGSVKPVWVGVMLAITLSIAVGVVLDLISASLPQAQQEGMETVIGAVAVAMVTFMIAWMNGHARGLKKELEADAGRALRSGSVGALALMAFLAVLREGFETSVFLLAAFQSSSSTWAAGIGALIGIVLSVLIGYGIYRGGVRINLGRFFSVTGVFLVLVAAGLVMSSLRTAHEAGWLRVGQARTVNLSWLAPNGSAQGALITGVLGIPPDPRVVEVLGWLLYLVPVMTIVLWPKSRHLTAVQARRLRFGLAGVLAVAAVCLAMLVRAPSAPAADGSALQILDSTGQSAGTVRLATQGGTQSLVLTGAHAGAIPLPMQGRTTESHLGAPTTAVHWQEQFTPTGRPTTLTLDQLAALNGGRLPVGISALRTPGPFTVSWVGERQGEAWLSHGMVIDAQESTTTLATLSDGGIIGSKTVPVAQPQSWSVAPQRAQQLASQLTAWQGDQTEIQLWNTYLPTVLGAAAVVLLAASIRRARPSLPAGTGALSEVSP